MKEEYVNAFLAPAKMVWEKELQTPLEFVGAQAVTHQYTTEDLTAILGVSGQLQGNVLYGFAGGTGLAVASAMIGETVTELDDMSMSALGELANMITGNAATQLSSKGYECDISPPLIIEPSGSRISTLQGVQILTSFKSQYGELYIRICLNENPNFKS
ncbi:MAG: chemotaxis protein CheX [Chloroflexi bacterium]|nr:chemotaxis protein CheX [Chloroflexota bacterium]MDA1226722.1 chemotaxis protein CheX [Chloroflexota bacterium]